MTAAANEQTFAARAGLCAFYALGIILTLLAYGLLQERIMQQTYDGALFEFSLFLVLMNRVAAVIFAVAMAVLNKEQLRNNAPIWKYGVISLASVYASTCQYEALKYVSFTVQMLGKSFKMMPVMLWGMAISGKRYGLKDWLIAAAVTAGVTEFLMVGPTAASNSQGSSLKGYLLMMGFLAMDGITSTMQEYLFKEHKSTKYNQMMYVNGISAITSLCTLIATGTLQPAVTFLFSHGRFAQDALTFNCTAVISQWFIYSHVKEFGALVFAATMNVRQVASIIFSYVIYHHTITHLQIIGLCVVFGALMYKSLEGLVSDGSKDEKKALLQSQKPAAPAIDALDKVSQQA